VKNQLKPFVLLASILLSACNSGGSTSSSTVPVISKTDLNLIFVPSMEQDEANLSITGYNHSLLFGQLLNKVTNGHVNAIYSFMPESQLINGFPNVAPLQTIQNYALLNSQGVIVSLPGSADEIASMINAIMGANNSGNFIFTLPIDLINQTLDKLGTNPSLSFDYNQVTNSHNYVILSVHDLQQITATTYNDNLTAATTFPSVNVNANSVCFESSVSFTFSPKDPALVNKDETVYFVRHAEAHPVPDFDNGDYVCQGQWRVIASPPILQAKIGKLPDYVYSSDPSEAIEDTMEQDYIRPSLTVNPFTIYYNMQLSLVPASQFAWSDHDQMAQYFFTDSKFDKKTLLVGWEHKNIDEAIKYLITDIYGQKLPDNFPSWDGKDYDTIWKVRINKEGDLTFSNTCEGIATSSLPTSCPAF